MRQELHIFFTALMFYTRIPCPGWVDFEEDHLNKATRYLPVIGWIVGGLSGLSFWAAIQLFDPLTSLLISLGISVLLTGAFHEDGFADACDGFGGGWTKPQILEIMKDSRVGTYGVVGLVLLFALKISLLYQLINDLFSVLTILLLFISVHTASRFVAATFIYTHGYVREDETSKVRPVAKSMPTGTLVIAFLFTAIPLIVWSIYAQNPWLPLLLIPMYAVKMAIGHYFNKKIGGYTGDCLGATQQATELVGYMILTGLIY